MQYDNEMKWQRNEMTTKWNDNEMKWQRNKIIMRWNDEIKWKKAKCDDINKQH
jgi:hypothetical protein